MLRCCRARRARMGEASIIGVLTYSKRSIAPLGRACPMQVLRNEKKTIGRGAGIAGTNEDDLLTTACMQKQAIWPLVSATRATFDNSYLCKWGLMLIVTL